MVSVERPKTNEKFASREKIRKWKTGLSTAQLRARGCQLKLFEITNDRRPKCVCALTAACNVVSNIKMPKTLYFQLLINHITYCLLRVSTPPPPPPPPPSAELTHTFGVRHLVLTFSRQWNTKSCL